MYLRQRGVTGANSVNPNIAAWSDDVRVTNEILDAAISKARVSLDGKPLGPNYLATIIPDLLNPKPVKKREPTVPLHAMTDRQLDALCGELGIRSSIAGESRDVFLARIREKQAEIRGRAA
ncbi:MAG: hypothetical protein EPN37_19210 [Chitinophagaceae bacterium]|nr:MAG: hypothetical protein EPN37_19210 [Chitinophagaceae bacterium]